MGIRWLRWTVLVVLICLGLVLLNHTLFSFWVAGGPPGSFKLGWLRHAYASSALTIATFIAAIGSFLALARPRQFGAAPLVLLALAGVLFTAPFIAREILIRQCVD